MSTSPLKRHSIKNGIFVGTALYVVTAYMAVTGGCNVLRGSKSPYEVGKAYIKGDYEAKAPDVVAQHKRMLEEKITLEEVLQKEAQEQEQEKAEREDAQQTQHGINALLVGSAAYVIAKGYKRAKCERRVNKDWWKWEEVKRYMVR